MPKSYGKIWLKGFKRLLKIQKEHAAKLTVRGKKTLGAKLPASSPRAKVTTAGERVRVKALSVTPLNSAPIRRQSRTVATPLGAIQASPQGTWTRTFFSAPPAPGELVNHLVYGLYLPPASRHSALPLVVMLHGCKQNIEDFAHGTRMNLLADRYGFAVLYPEQSKHAQASRCWHWYEESVRAGAKEVASIAALVSAVVERQEIDPARVYAAGMSAGAGMTILLAMRYPQLFAAVALHSAPAFGGAHSAAGALSVMQRGVRGDPLALLSASVNLAQHSGMPALIMQGDADPIVAAVNADQLELQFLALNGALQADGQLRPGIKVETVTSDTLQAPDRATSAATPSHTVSSPARQRDYRINQRVIVRTCHIRGLAHGWSGGDDAYAFHSSRGPDASLLMWEFFSVWRRD